MNAQILSSVIDELTRTLQREHERVAANVRALVEAEQALGASQAQEGSAIGTPADVATDLADQELDLGLQEASSARLAAIDAALRRIANGRYGSCERCSNPIGVGRLQALPWAAECIECASRLAPGGVGARGSH